MKAEELTKPTPGALRVSEFLTGHMHIGETYQQWESRKVRNALMVDRETGTAELLTALKESQAALMNMHKYARGMWNELLEAGFADKGLKMMGHDQSLAAIKKARAAIAKAEGRT